MLHEYLLVLVSQASREFPFPLEIQVSQGFLAALGGQPVLADLCDNNESLLMSILKTNSPNTDLCYFQSPRTFPSYYHCVIAHPSGRKLKKAQVGETKYKITTHYKRQVCDNLRKTVGSSYENDNLTYIASCYK